MGLRLSRWGLRYGWCEYTKGVQAMCCGVVFHPRRPPNGWALGRSETMSSVQRAARCPVLITCSLFVVP